MSRELPTRKISECFHIGTLDPRHRGRNYGSSYEGHGLSISRDPEEWERIAKLGGNRWWRLSCSDGCFLDAQRLTKAQRSEIIDWAVAHGYAERQDAWRVSYYNDEVEDTVGYLFFGRAEALAERRELADCGMEPTMRKVETVVGTPAFCERTGLPAGAGNTDHQLVLYAEELTDLDGVWWEARYSHMWAPRGCILPGKLSRWQRECVREPRVRG